MHKAGFVSITGFPNAGKSTLLNALLGEKLMIVTPKAQTTRRRILGIYNDDETQIVFSDTPGYISEPGCQLHKKMNSEIEEAFTDADLMIYITEHGIKTLDVIESMLNGLKCPLLILVNKADTENAENLASYADDLQKQFPDSAVKIISALHGFNIEQIIPYIKSHLREHPPYFDKEQLSNRDVRFFVSEMIREKLLKLYFREIPYCAEVVIDEYKEDKDMSRIRAIIYVERETQKMIILGKGGSAIKRLGIESRQEIEKFVGQKIYLDLSVKVLKNWRNDESILKKLGY